MDDFVALELAKRNPGIGVTGAKGLIAQRRDWLAENRLDVCKWCQRLIPESLLRE
jgi:hypothetical protein